MSCGLPPSHHRCAVVEERLNLAGSPRQGCSALIESICGVLGVRLVQTRLDGRGGAGGASPQLSAPPHLCGQGGRASRPHRAGAGCGQRPPPAHPLRVFLASPNRSILLS